MKATEKNLTELSRKLGLPANVNPSFEQMREAGIEPPSRPKAPPTPPATVEFIGKRVGQVVCKGDIRLGSGCGSCTRCRQQIAVLIAENSSLKDLLAQAAAMIRNADVETGVCCCVECQSIREARAV